MTREIRAWSGTHKAREHYSCKTCGAIIPKGVVYHSVVLSDDDKDPAHTAFRVQHHLDCAAPWYQPSDVNRLHHVGRIPHQTPPEFAIQPLLEGLPKLNIFYSSPTAGEISWQLPPDFSKRILYMPDLTGRKAVFYELEMHIATAAEAAIACASSIRRSRDLGHHMYDVQITTGFTPIAPDWGIDLEDE